MIRQLHCLICFSELNWDILCHCSVVKDTDITIIGTARCQPYWCSLTKTKSENNSHCSCMAPCLAQGAEALGAWVLMHTCVCLCQNVWVLNVWAGSICLLESVSIRAEGFVVAVPRLISLFVSGWSLLVLDQGFWLVRAESIGKRSRDESGGWK